MVRRAAIETKGAAGPSGMDASTWRKLLASRKNPSLTNDLREVITKLARKKCKEDCKYLEQGSQTNGPGPNVACGMVLSGSQGD